MAAVVVRVGASGAGGRWTRPAANWNGGELAGGCAEAACVSRGRVWVGTVPDVVISGISHCSHLFSNGWFWNVHMLQAHGSGGGGGW